jgi:hypothetical protein
VCKRAQRGERVDRGYAAAMKTTEQILREANALGIEVTVSTAPPKTTGEIVLLPGLREPKQT